MDFVAATRSALAAQRRMCHTPDPHGIRTFRDLLSQLEGTQFGTDHQIRSDMSPQDFRHAVPIRTYAGFEPYFERLARGESNVLTQSAPFSYYRTSGTSGRPKYIPATFHQREMYRGPALYAQWGLYFEYLGMDRYIPGSVLDLSWERSMEPKESLGGLPVYSITQRPASLGGNDWTPPWYEDDWFRAQEGESASMANRRRMLAAARQQSLRLIVSVNPSKLIALIEQINGQASWLVETLEQEAATRPIAERLKTRLESGSLRATDLWPELSLIVCWNSASARLYRPWLENLFPGVHLIPFSTTGTEGIVTLPVDDDHPGAGPLAVNQGYYEFVEVPDLDCDQDLAPDAATVGFSELEVGKTYRLVMTQATGLCRLDVGDAYEVVGWVGKLPRLEFVGRLGFRSSFTGEKLSEQDLHAAVLGSLDGPPKPGGGVTANGAHGTDQDLPMFTGVPIWGEPPKYVVAIEWDAERFDGSPAEVGRAIDTRLQAVNSEYKEKRDTQRLQPLTLIPLEPGAFRRRGEALIRQGTSPAQIKHHWLQRNDDLLRWFETNHLTRCGGNR